MVGTRQLGPCREHTKWKVMQFLYFLTRFHPFLALEGPDFWVRNSDLSKKDTFCSI